MSKEAVEQMDAILATLPAAARRVGFTLQCAAFAACARGFPQGLVARAMNLSTSTLSHIAAANKHDSRRYARIADEYARLGHDEFCAHYLTDELASRLARFRMNVETSDDVRSKFGPDPRADKYADRPFPLTAINGVQLILVISFRGSFDDRDDDTNEPYPMGYAWRELTEQEVGAHRYFTAHARWSRKRWRGSALALDGCFESHGLEPPLMEFKQDLAMTHKLTPLGALK